MNRRTILQMLPAAVAAPLAAAPKIDTSAGFRLGVATYSLRGFTRPQTIEMLKVLDVDTVSLKEMHAKIKGDPSDWTAARKELEAAGIRIVSCGNIGMTVDDDAEIEHNFKYAQTLGAEGIVMAPNHQTLPRIEKFVKKYNIKAMIHNHGPEDKNFPTPKSVYDAVKNMDSRMGLCIDIGHTVRTGTSVLDAINMAGPRLLDFHIKDLKVLTERDSQVAVGDGNIPIPAIFKLLRKVKYTGNANLEYEINLKDPLPGMVKSFAYMRGVLAGMQA
ncbi:MAG TPA: sugar phosphate isomerase/epimerase [Bryobacteraceae bacterium]|nr:sugar phosphate isomerase/epimerase [Bryobacteraceae bacterium]